MRLRRLEPRFVETVPKEREDGILYISTTYGTMVHNCACGCRMKVTTPLSPARWRLTYDGETVSVRPSIGNWSFPCRSHYWIERNEVRWASGWSEDRIVAGRTRDRTERRRYAEAKAAGRPFEPEAAEPASPKGPSLLRRLLRHRG
jgi:hypothetical protein